MTIRRVAVRHSFPGLAEAESAERVTQALRSLGVEAETFVGADGLDEFSPDFVLCLSHHEGKSTRHMTLGVIMAPLSWLACDQLTIERIRSYDGFLSTSDSLIKWLSVVVGVPQADLPVANYTNTTPETEWPGSWEQDRPPHAVRLAYFGTNWDRCRHASIFDLLGKRSYMRFHGPEESWRHMPAQAYGGAVPFDGRSVLEVYRRAGAGLALDRPDFVPDGLTSNRIFEIVAAGAVALVPESGVARQMFGDSVLYLDAAAPPAALVWQIDAAMAWIRSNPHAAADMARNAHERFCRNFSLERLLPNVFSLYEALIAAPTNRASAAPAAPEPLALHAGAHPLTIQWEITGLLEGGASSTRWTLDAQTVPVLPDGRLVVHLPADADDALPPAINLRSTDEAWCQPIQKARRVGGLWRLSFAAQDRRLWAALASGSAYLSGARAPVAVCLHGECSHVASLSEVVTAGTVWIVGAGEGGRRVAQSLEAAGHLAGFLDDFISEVDGHHVTRLSDAAHVIRPDDVVILATQHWMPLWQSLADIAAGGWYCAHPSYDDHLTVIPDVFKKMALPVVFEEEL